MERDVEALLARKEEELDVAMEKEIETTLQRNAQIQINKQINHHPFYQHADIRLDQGQRSENDSDSDSDTRAAANAQVNVPPQRYGW